MKTFLKRMITATLAATLANTALANTALESADPESTTKATEKLKIGFVYVGPVGDAGWTYGHDEGRREMVEKLGDKVETTYVEKCF